MVVSFFACAFLTFNDSFRLLDGLKNVGACTFTSMGLKKTYFPILKLPLVLTHIDKETRYGGPLRKKNV